MAIATRRGTGLDGDAGMVEDSSAWSSSPDVSEGLDRWRGLMRADMAREMKDPRWPRALVAVGVVHLAACLVCHALLEPVARRDPRYPLIWLLEVATILAVLRLLAGRGWLHRSAAVKLAAKFWTTFLILAFNVVSLNALTGIEDTWYRPAWGTLSTFFFASMAWLFTPLFFIPAVWMWATGMLMALFNPEAYLIYGVSWFLVLCGVAANLRRAG